MRAQIGESFYQHFRVAKGGLSAGCLLPPFAELPPAIQAAFRAAADAAQEGLQPAHVHAAYLAAREGRAFDGQPAPGWMQLADRHAWTAAAEACRS